MEQARGSPYGCRTVQNHAVSCWIAGTAATLSTGEWTPQIHATQCRLTPHQSTALLRQSYWRTVRCRIAYRYDSCAPSKN